MSEASLSAAPDRRPAPNRSSAPNDTRVTWVDYAKGLSILLVVQYHSTLGITEHVGHESWGTAFAAFCYSFRMPLFFVVAGLFLARSIGRDWRTYLDRKVLHFAYFYVVWVTIKFILKAPSISGGDPMVWLSEYALAFVQPFGPLWFIYMLAVFFIVTKLLRNLPMPVVFLAAACLHIAHLETGSVVVDQFASRYVFFLMGYLLADSIFALARKAAPNAALVLVAVLGFFLINGLVLMSGNIDVPGMTLALGVLGTLSMIAGLAVLAEKGLGRVLAFCGSRSLAIYLAFFIPMSATRTLGIKLFGTTPMTADVLAIVVPVAAVAGALLMAWVLPKVGAGFLYVRPTWARLTPDAPGRAEAGMGLPTGSRSA